MARPAAATEVLTNGGFESWAGASPAGWTTFGDVSKATSPSVSGNSARVGSQSKVQHQLLPAVAAATYVFSFSAASETGTAHVSYAIAFEDEGFASIGSSDPQLGGTSGSFSVQTITRTAPAGTAFVQVIVTSVDAAIYVDNASLDEVVPPSTPTPDVSPVTATPTPTDEGVIATPSDTPSAETPPGGGGSSSSKTPTATRTPTTAKPPTATKTPTSTKTPANTKTPTPEKQPKTTAPLKPTATPGGKPPTPNPTTAGSSIFGGMLYNGDFEVDDAGKPDGWSKFGGTMTLTSAAYDGDYSAELDSDTSSTKWLYQVVPVDSGDWYALHGVAAVRGAGEAFIRVSWYASDDGSGTSSDQADSDVAANSDWLPIATGPVQAPADAHSARARLMFRPSGNEAAGAVFDDVEMVVTDQRPPDDTPPQTPPGASGGLDDGPPTPRPGPAQPNRNVAVPATESPAQADRSAMSSIGLRLSEVLSDPVEPGQDAPFEWVELVNIGTADVNTAGWKLGDGKEMDPMPAFVVPPGGFLVVAGRSTSMPATVPLVRVADGEIGGGLNNTGDTLHLVAPDGAEADSLSYGDDQSVFDPPPPAPPAGGTLGVRAPNSDPDADNWALTDRPTPGEPNSFAAPRPKPTTTGGVADAPAAGVRPGPLVIRPAASGVPVALWVIVAALGSAVGLLLAFFVWDRFIVPKVNPS